MVVGPKWVWWKLLILQEISVARVTVEDCLEKIPNRFELIHIAAKRVRQLAKGSKPMLSHTTNKQAVIALREIAAGFVSKAEPETSEDGEVTGS